MALVRGDNTSAWYEATIAGTPLVRDADPDNPVDDTELGFFEIVDDEEQQDDPWPRTDSTDANGIVAAASR